MSQEEAGKKKPAEQFSEMIKSFGDAIGQIFNDPELKEKAKTFRESVVESAKILASNVKDDETKAKFREMGKEAEKLGKSIQDYFKEKIHK
jgi:ribosomal-protein-alanine N-acetyltransferase